MRILLPKRMSQVDLKYGPFFFFAGPVRGGGDWQHKLVMEILKNLPQFTAALPCRYADDHPLMKFREDGEDDKFPHQLDWERRYLEIAARSGCIIFWLGKESKESPRTDGNPYALETYGELGEWRGRLMTNPNLRIVIGADPDFPGLDSIRRNYELATGKDFRICTSMSEVAEAAAWKAW